MDNWTEYENDLKQARKWDRIYSVVIVSMLIATVVIGALILITW